MARGRWAKFIVPAFSSGGRCRRSGLISVKGGATAPGTTAVPLRGRSDRAQRVVRESPIHAPAQARDDDSGNYEFAICPLAITRLPSTARDSGGLFGAEWMPSEQRTSGSISRSSPAPRPKPRRSVLRRPSCKPIARTLGEKSKKAGRGAPLAYNRNFQGLLNWYRGQPRASRALLVLQRSGQLEDRSERGNPGWPTICNFEGVDDNERTGLLQVYLPPIEAIQTVDVTTSITTRSWGVRTAR